MMIEPSVGESSQLVVRSCGMTDPGKVRDSNEDHFLIASLVKSLQVHSTSIPQPKVQQSSDRGYLFMVADGMGGHAGGQRASALAIDSVETFVLEQIQWFSNLTSRSHDDVLADFQKALSLANYKILAEAADRPSLREMGTTLTLAYSVNDDLFVAHVGDSRCYLYRGQLLHRLTRDHTLVEEMVRRGLLRAEEVEEHGMRHVITNVVGGSTPEVNVDVHRLRLRAGDRVLLCSDGLTNMLSDDHIGEILRVHSDPTQVCRHLIDQANQAGGQDNITVIYVVYDL